MGWYYRGKGVGTTGLFVNSNDAMGNARDSNGYLAQVTYKIGNYQSRRELRREQSRRALRWTARRLASAHRRNVVGCLVRRNDKWSLGLYQNVTDNLLFVTEFSRLESESDANQTNSSWNINAGFS